MDILRRGPVPSPRQPVSEPSLTRPNWLVTAPRPEGVLWLDKNENLDPALLRVTQKILSDLDPLALCTYPECAAIYRKLSSWVDLPPEYFILSAGSDGAIRYAFEAFVSEGDAVMHTDPTFAMYPVYSTIYGAKVQRLTYQESPRGPVLPIDTVIRAIRDVRPKLFCLPNPDSPTGTVFPPEDLRKIIETGAEVGAVVLIDEAYHPFYEHSVAQWTRQFPNLIVARTFAKAWGLAGLRIGYAIAHPDLCQYLHKVRPMYEVNTLSVFFIERMLDHASDMLASVKRLNDGKKVFLGAMDRLGFQSLRGEGNFLHVAFGDASYRVHEALKGKVLYRLDFKEPCLHGFSRFSSTTSEQFQPVIRWIQESVR